MDLGVYVCCYNEDRLIQDCIRPVKRVFPQVKVLDLGSTDDTINKIKEMGVDYDICPFTHGRDYTNVRNEYSKKHDWVFFIDGDEVYSISSLLRAKETITYHDMCGDNRYGALKISWLFLMEDEDNGSLSMARNSIVGGIKIFRPSEYNFVRAWPREIVVPIGAVSNRARRDGKQPNDEENGIVSWHCSLLRRSSRKEDTARRKKRECNINLFSKTLVFRPIPMFPWKLLEQASIEYTVK